MFCWYTELTMPQTELIIYPLQLSFFILVCRPRTANSILRNMTWKRVLGWNPVTFFSPVTHSGESTIFFHSHKGAIMTSDSPGLHAHLRYSIWSSAWRCFSLFHPLPSLSVKIIFFPIRSITYVATARKPSLNFFLPCTLIELTLLHPDFRSTSI